MIEVSDLTVRYGRKRAVDALSITVRQGESVLLAGANGSGKTTLLRSMCGLLIHRGKPVRVDGRTLNHRSRRRIAYIPASISFYDSLRVGEAIRLHASCFQDFTYRPPAEFEIERHRRVGTLSKGEKTLFILSLALATHPNYLLIDDVIHFLDPHLRELFLKTILGLIEEQQLGLLMAAQSAFDIEGILDRVVVLDKGKIVLDEAVERLKGSFVRVYSDRLAANLPVVFTRDWGDFKEFFLYPYSDRMETGGRVDFLTLSEIVHATIGGKYGGH